MDHGDHKSQRDYARSRSQAHDRPKAAAAALKGVRLDRLRQGFGYGHDREHNLGKLAKHVADDLEDSTVLSPVVPAQVVEPVWPDAVTTREVRLDELPLKVKRHRRGVSGEYEVVAPLRKVIALDDEVEEEDWEDLSSERLGSDDRVSQPTKRSYAQAVKA